MSASRPRCADVPAPNDAQSAGAATSVDAEMETETALGAGGELAPGTPAVVTVDELAALLRVERKTAYTAIARGEIPGVRRIGRALRISRSAVLEWLRQGQVRAPRSRRTA